MTHLRLKEIRRLPTHWGERVTFFISAGYEHHKPDTAFGRKDQIHRLKTPVFMRLSRNYTAFHKKMTFSYRFGRACCIHPHIVGNGT